MTIKELLLLRESEDNVEFKQDKSGNFSYKGGNKNKVSDRRRCILGYVTAFANEEGGLLVFGIREGSPHQVVGSTQSQGATGKLRADIYRDTGIMVTTEELIHNNDLRVLIIKIPKRPTGKIYTFEDVPLMRVGDELKPMPPGRQLQITQELDPDFSKKICEGLTIDDLDDEAVQIMQKAYARKQDNPRFLTLSKELVLADLELASGTKITNAALILLGKARVIKERIPQSSIKLEYRKDDGQISFDKRYEFIGSFYSISDKLWDAIDLRNGSFPIQDGPYIFDIPHFNQEVIRESIYNAVAHRDYTLNSEIIIK